MPSPDQQPPTGPDPRDGALGPVAELAVELVTRAAALAADLRRGGLEAVAKTSVSDVVTAADTAAEAFITGRVAERFPDDGIVGEEGTAVAGRSGRSWVIDPVDGTYNFVSGLSYWCSALAVRDDADVLLGAVHHHASGETFVGGPDRPTTLDGVPVAPLADAPLEAVSLSTYLHPPLWSDPRAREPFLAIASRAATLRMLGSGSMDLAGVATGRLGVWAQHSTPAWDWLPGAALVRGAGGRAEVVEHRGLHWHVAGNALAVQQVIELVTGS